MAKPRTKTIAPAPQSLPKPLSALETREPDDDEMDRIVDWITQGQTEFRIRQRIAKTLPNLNPRDALVAAMTRVAANLDAAPGVVMAWTFESARAVYRQLFAAGEYGEALKALRFINEVACKMASAKPSDPASDVQPASQTDSAAG